MFNPWLFYMFANVVVVILLAPFIDQEFAPFTRYSRLTITHRIFTFRNKFFPFINPRPEGMDADSKALDELILLYQLSLDDNENSTQKKAELLRYHSKRMLTGLHPTQSSSCLVKNHIFQYDDNRVDMYSIQHDPTDHWRNSNRPFVLYFHGGGFVSGDIETYSGFECHLSKDLNMLILHVNFRLVPEASLEDIIEDVTSVYQLLIHIDRNIHQRIIGMGDSSGGLLWIHLLQWIIVNNKPLPQAVVLHSPWPNLNFLDTYIDHPVDSYFSEKLVDQLRQLLTSSDLNGSELSDQTRRKLKSSENVFQRFPPLYITAGTDEYFINEIHQMTRKMESLGVDVILDEGIGLMHTYALFHLWSSKAKCTQERIRQWIGRQLFMKIQSTSNREMQSNLFC